MPQAFCYLTFISEVPFLLRVKRSKSLEQARGTYQSNNLAQVPHGFEQSGFVLITIWNDDLCSRLSCIPRLVDAKIESFLRTQFGYEVSAQESCTAKDSGNVARDSTVAWGSIRIDGFLGSVRRDCNEVVVRPLA